MSLTEENYLNEMKALLEDPDALPWHLWIEEHGASLKKVLPRAVYLRLKFGSYDAVAEFLQEQGFDVEWCPEARTRNRYTHYHADVLDETGRPIDRVQGLNAYIPEWTPDMDRSKAVDALVAWLEEATDDADGPYQPIADMSYEASMLMEREGDLDAAVPMLLAVIRFGRDREPYDLIDPLVREAREKLET